MALASGTRLGPYEITAGENMKKLLVAIPLVLSVGCVQPDESNVETASGPLVSSDR